MVKAEQNKKNRFKPFKNRNDYRYWSKVIEETAKVL